MTMNLKKRIIPCLDVDNGKVVKGINFVNIREAGDPVELALRYRNEGADELIFLDIMATSGKRGILRDVVKKVAWDLDIPFTVGGGIRSFEDAQDILHAGADKISLNSAAVRSPDIISELADCFGKQCVVVAIDAKRETEERYAVYTHGGRNRTNRHVLSWAKEVEKLGAGEILLTSMDRDGTKDGFDIVLTSMISSALSIPVIASGGAGELNHFQEVFVDGKADAALAASIFHYRNHTIQELKEYLSSEGVAVRI